ncbi:MAG: hypothetical protein ACRDHW_14700, partial [Ktedonobacteraceae bacterium]
MNSQPVGSRYMQDADRSQDSQDSMDSMDSASIDQLPERVAALPTAQRALVGRLFEIVETEGVIVPPPEMGPWLERTFGSVEATLRQRIIRVTNRWTFEGATFN